ncbi:unnamed protein product [Spirodela intermedia]|uniref:Uncharacterized protein n=2 Tax=Spirodela intermedia TaxID=51605 RepID=A0A7I8KCW0_SPIIN|nr:unnamed protein product [Spirodela intermedia]CAA6659310.1 unnamed protein product [Spirodela intermedia]CAA7395617.1 unnamed protein product [Spirodela intermedia]
MSATVLDDAISISNNAETGGPHYSQKTSATTAEPPSAEVESANCDCCGLTEECTPAYIEHVRERYDGRWLCGLCAEAVKEEISRSGQRLIGAEEALKRHITFCRSFRSSPAPMAADANDHLITAMRQLFRRGFDSPRAARSASNSPRRRIPGDEDSPRSPFRPATYFSPPGRLSMQS